MLQFCVVLWRCCEFGALGWCVVKIGMIVTGFVGNVTAAHRNLVGFVA